MESRSSVALFFSRTCYTRRRMKRSGLARLRSTNGAIAQLAVRFPSKEEVLGSNPSGAIFLPPCCSRCIGLAAMPCILFSLSFCQQPGLVQRPSICSSGLLGRLIQDVQITAPILHVRHNAARPFQSAVFNFALVTPCLDNKMKMTSYRVM